jgi:Na+/H+ antiporter NhaD/arsenite permease-like protein
VLFPFHVPILVPRVLWQGFLNALSSLRIIGRRKDAPSHRGTGRFVRFRFPFNFVTAPLIADLFLLAILAIGRDEVKGGTIGANSISPVDIMAFFITLAYIAISIDASGLIRYMAFKVLQWGGKAGHRLFLFLYAFFFILGTMIGNDPIILSGTAFLAYMTRVSSNIIHPRAWIHTQFAISNIASAILVSSNPTNLVLAGAFQITFINYTANMIVPVVITAIVLFPFLLYIIFADESLVPLSIDMHTLPEEARVKKPVNPNIPHARGAAEEVEDDSPMGETGQRLSLEEIMNPFLDKGGAWFGGIVMATALITLLALNAVGQAHDLHLQVFWVTLPAAFVMLCWDIGFGWWNRHDTREIARRGRREVAEARAEKARKKELASKGQDTGGVVKEEPALTQEYTPEAELRRRNPASDGESLSKDGSDKQESDMSGAQEGQVDALDEKKGAAAKEEGRTAKPTTERATLTSLARSSWMWSQDTFPTATAVLAHLPFALIPFAFTMFILVQALVTKGWVPVFAYGWDHWVHKTGTVGAIGGMAFLSVILCNVSTLRASCIMLQTD